MIYIFLYYVSQTKESAQIITSSVSLAMDYSLATFVSNVITDTSNFSEIRQRKYKYWPRPRGVQEYEYLRSQSVVRKLSKA